LYSNISPPHSDEYIQHCINNLRSPNPRQRSQAAQALGKLQATCATADLAELVTNDLNTYVRSACAEALGHINAPEAIFPLMDALRDSCTFVRRAAAISLGQMQAKQAQGALLQTLDDSNFYVRRAAINAIGKLDIPELGNVLLPLLTVEDSRIRRTTITALRRLRTREAIPTMSEVLTIYVRAPSQRDLPVVKTLVLALGELRAQEAVPVLMQVVQGYVGGRSMAANALGQIGDVQAGPILVEALADRSFDLQLAALKSLGKLHYLEARPHIKQFIMDSNPRLRRAAVLTLGQLADAEDISILLSVAQNDSSPLVRPVAVEALGLIGNAEIIPQLLPLANDANAYLRAALVNTLMILNGHIPEVEAVLQQLTQDKVAHVAHTARYALKAYQQQTVTNIPTDGVERVAKPVPWFKRLFSRT